MKTKYEKVMNIVRRRGFIWPSFELHGGAAGFFDFGPLGTALKEKLIRKWREFYVIREGSFEIDSPTITPEPVLKASGHLDHFTDVMSECNNCGRVFEVTELVKEKTGKRIEGLRPRGMKKYLRDIECPKCGGKLGEPHDFSTMFRTTIGAKEGRTAYLRPETAQSIFIDFKRLQRIARKKLPFAVAQIGKGYRNELSPRRGMIRLREFTMAEVEVFFDPEEPHHPHFGDVGDEELKLLPATEQEKRGEKPKKKSMRDAVKKELIHSEYIAYHLARGQKFLTELGIPISAIRFREHLPGELSHYSKETWDMEVSSEKFGWIEVAGFAYRTDYDLSRHSKSSKSDMRVFVQRGDEVRRVLPHVVEPSYGIDRALYCVLEHAYTEKDGRGYFRIRKDIAPLEVKVFPLLSGGGLPEKSMGIVEKLKEESFFVEYDESGSIGRRYARADEVGVPYCVTIDHQTLEDSTVTIRDRDTTSQIRVQIQDLPKILFRLLRGKVKFENAGELISR